MAGQLVRVLSGPRPLATGTYTVTVSLHPESLGSVQATVTGGDARLSVQLVAATSAGADAIRQSLPDLHAALAADGQQATVSLSGGGAQGSSIGPHADGSASGTGQQFGSPAGRQAGGTGPGRPAASASPEPSGPPVATRTGSTSGQLVDVHV